MLHEEEGVAIEEWGFTVLKSCFFNKKKIN
jgi:hypothetical protein